VTFGWHPREHRKALDGMLMLTLEERGAYNTCLDLIYDREGPIPDDARWLSGWMGVTPRKWAAIRAALIVKGKLYEIAVDAAACLMNKRAAIEIENQSERSRKLSENGARGGRKSAETRTKANENNTPVEATPQASLKLLTRTETKTSSDDDSAGARYADWDRASLDDLTAALRQAAGDALNAAAPKLHVVAPILALLRPGSGPAADLDLDVIPAIRAAAPKVPRPGYVTRWDYFVPMITEARDRRLQGAPALGEPIPERATGPPNASLTDRIGADNAEARRRAFALMDAQNGRTN
jgi:uncharacterized protein YdaU (DUF1376 family)